MTRLWRRGVLDSIVAQAMAALMLAIFGAALWAVMLWHMSMTETNRWHETVRGEISTYRDDGDTDAMILRLQQKGIDATYHPTSRRPFQTDNATGGEQLWVRLPTHVPTWAAFEPRKNRGVSVWAWVAGMAALAGCLSWMMAWQWVRPLRKLARSADDIVKGKAPPDITSPLELAQLSEALGQAACAAKLASEERKLFLAGVSHDLRQPLARIRMAMAIAPMEDKELASGIERDLVEMDSLLSQFIGWVRDGQDEIKTPVDLAVVVDELTQLSGVDWNTQLPAIGQAVILAPPLALRRALANLLNNAEKHGKAPFTCTVEKQGDDWWIQISDQGHTTPPGQMETLLQPFKGQGARAGAGLGLAVVSRVIAHLGGALEFEPNTPSGWIVSVKLPAALLEK